MAKKSATTTKPQSSKTASVASNSTSTSTSTSTLELTGSSSRHELSEFERGGIVWLHKYGVNPTEIARTMEIPRTTILSTIHRWTQTGTTASNPRSGRPPKLTDTEMASLKKSVEQHRFQPYSYHQTHLASQGVSISRGTIIAYIRKMGLQPSTPGYKPKRLNRIAKVPVTTSAESAATMSLSSRATAAATTAISTILSIPTPMDDVVANNGATNNNGSNYNHTTDNVGSTSVPSAQLAAPAVEMLSQVSADHQYHPSAVVDSLHSGFLTAWQNNQAATAAAALVVAAATSRSQTRTQHDSPQQQENS